MTDFLLELRCEEIPARMQAGARADLEKLFRKELGEAGVAVGDITVWSTPRRLALIARDLPEATEAVREETKGPRVGAPPQALEGFLRKTGLTQDQLEERDGVYFAVAEKPGRAVKAVLAEAIPAIVRAFPWPKSMRWGAASLTTDSPRWVRPLSGIVAIFGEELVECTVGDVASGYMTLGHRFHCPGPITIGGVSDYQEKLRACHVIVDHAERQNLIRERAASVAAEAGLTLIEDEGLVIENAGLTEWPVPLVGRFDPAFLEVPPEVIQLTARTNQKYFVCKVPPQHGEGDHPQGGGGGSPHAQRSPDSPLHHQTASGGPPPRSGEELANAFVCTANIEATDGGASIVDGNRKVLAARLSDARFFWEQDRKTPLAEHAKKLERITFHEKLGTVADKVERVAKLARWLVEEGIVTSSPGRGGGSREAADGGGPPLSATSRKAASPLHHPADGPPPRAGEDLANLAEQAARLCKADLVTEMVGEFPELQGLMGGYYARAEGLPDEVADAIRDHYKPIGQGDEVPTAPVTVAVSLADKLDTIREFYRIGEKPTGSKDPYGLRRAAIGIAQIALSNKLSMSLVKAMTSDFPEGPKQLVEKTVLSEAGVNTDALLNAFSKFDESWKKQFAGIQKALTIQLPQIEIPTIRLPEIPVPKIDTTAIDRLATFAKNLQANTAAISATLTLLTDRLKVQQREAGVRHDLIDAVFALGNEDDLVRLLARVKALQNFVETEDGANLLAAYKRAANILKKEDWRGIEGEIARTGEEDPLALVDDPDLAPVIAAKMVDRQKKQLSYTPEPAEKELIEALDSAEPRAKAAIEAEDFEGAMAALASLRAPIDRFFDSVTVNDEDPAKRAARLDLLARFRDAVHQVGNFSKIEG